MLANLEKKGWEKLYSFSPKVGEALYIRRRVLKYIVAGGSAAVVDISTLYITKGILGIPLIPAVSIAFFFGFCASFIFQKFWAFEDRSTDRVHAQAVLYFVVSGVNFFLNIVFMYVLVEVLLVWYILAKILVSGGIAFSSFFIYRIFIFKTPHDTTG
ncbi:MAG: GtrA family protein [Candidatus Taylorbacteria bacterium]|nr:GtrA family protein [Candidatus Taylorbacteria bacterium]